MDRSTQFGGTGWEISTVSTYTAQCGKCFKWRLVPSLQHYQKIREKITERPWVCKYAVEWGRVVHCGIPEDTTPSDSQYWIFDSTDVYIPAPPPRWQRIVQVLCSSSGPGYPIVLTLGILIDGSSYIAPDGEALYSKPQVKRYIGAHPRSISMSFIHDRPEGVSVITAIMAKFNFCPPKVLPPADLQRST